MEIIFLGTGSSTGVPIIGCGCKVCVSRKPENRRLRTSLLIRSSDRNVLIDVSPDFRMQALLNGISNLDAILITHAHADHINGFDDIRQINFLMNLKTVPVYANRFAYEEIRKRFDYVFMNTIHFGGGKPLVDLNIIQDFEEIDIGSMKIYSFPFFHGKTKVSGFRIGDISYITDISFLPSKALEFIKDTKVLIISALRYIPHSTHFTITEVLNLVSYIKPEITYLTHMGHDLDYHEVLEFTKNLHVFPAYDGLKIVF